MSKIPIDYIREALSYDPVTGVLTWLERPREHFRSIHRQRVFNTRYAGLVAGTRSCSGYRMVELMFSGTRCLVRGHRIAWVLSTGAWPLNEIDHINGDRCDNRFKNLREATRGEQLQNQKLSNETTAALLGFRGMGRRRSGKLILEPMVVSFISASSPRPSSPTKPISTPKLAFTHFSLFRALLKGRLFSVSKS